MPRIDNITKWECDRCGRKLYAAPGDPEASTWAQPVRTNVKGDAMAMTLCTECSRVYVDIVGRHDGEISAFINECRDIGNGREERA